MDGGNRSGQRAVVLAQLVPDQHFVEMDVAVNECRQQHFARAVRDPFKPGPGPRADTGYSVTVDHHVGDRPPR
jgi:hypothetical protein